MGTPVTNFGKVTVSTGYDASALSIVLTTGHGSRLPSTFPYPLSWWNATDYPDPADDPNKEIVIVTARSSDTLTVTRAGEGTSATTKNTGGKTYKMALGITKNMWEELQARGPSQSVRNLHMQSHPDNNAAAVKLWHADSIVMSDGEEIFDWNNLSAVLTSNGAGGLDTGSEGASTLYEIHAIYDGTNKNLLLHRSKDYLLDEDINAAITEDATQGIRSNADNSTIKVSQGFQMDVAGPVPFIDVKLIKVGTPTGNIWFTLESNNGGVPNNTPLATSDKLDVSRILPTNATWVRVIFRAPASLSASTQYHLVAQGDWTVSGANYIGWRMDGSAAGYSKGSKALYDSDTSTWTSDSDDDLCAKIYVTENDVALTLPSGYQQSALIGFAYNNAGSNLKHFTQKDRTIFYGYDDDWQVGAFTDTTPALINLAAFLPPMPMTVIFLTYNAAALHMAMGNLFATDLSTTHTDERLGVVRCSNPGGYVVPLELVLGPYQGVMFIASGGTTNLYVGQATF